MHTILDIDNWNRKDHFNFFKQLEEPFFGVCVTIDCTTAFKKSKVEGQSFFLSYLHKTLVAVNSVECFRYRISGDDIFVYDQIDASPTIGRPDGTFGFSYMKYHKDFKKFEIVAKKEIERVSNSTGLEVAVSGENVVHFSSLPWLDFTSFSHARSFTFPDSAPKISFGKMTENNGKKSFSVSIHVHHGLVDGFHVGQFVEKFQELMNA
ncbi:MAG: chloramphenicol acetyltransferase [Urechidicola sp.]|nr:chloramphenicol acetyltransferase [Urechidicola sp.]